MADLINKRTDGQQSMQHIIGATSGAAPGPVGEGSAPAADEATLPAMIAELREELSRSRVQAEVFRALYTRQAAEIEALQARIDTLESAPVEGRLRVARPD